VFYSNKTAFFAGKKKNAKNTGKNIELKWEWNLDSI